MPPDYPQQPPQPPQYPSTQPPATPYDFIVNPDRPPKQKFSFPGLSGSSSPLKRIIFIIGALFVIFILFSIVKNLLVSKPNLNFYISIAQDQQELIHIVNYAQTTNQLVTLSPDIQNLAATILVSTTSNQTQVLKYLSVNHLKVKTKILNLKVSHNLDNELASALAAGTYNSAFLNAIKSQTQIYSHDLNLAFPTSGKKGRALLVNQYVQSQLIYKQANSISAVPTP